MIFKSLYNRIVPLRGHLRGCLASQSRLYTSNSPELEIIKDAHKKDFVILKLDRPPTNSLNLDAVKDLGYQIDIFEQNPDLKGVIITSELPGVFSAGLDIMELYQAEPERLESLWAGVQNLWEKLYGSQKIYIAAINGHSLALGCLISMACDYRIMASESNFRTGLTANRLGISPPSWIMDTMKNTIGHRQAELALQLGRTFTPEEALRVKLVDEIVPETEVLEAAEKQMQRWCQIPSEARGISKQGLRCDTINRFKLNRVHDLNEFVNAVSSEQVQASIKNYLKQLKEKHSYL